MTRRLMLAGLTVAALAAPGAIPAGAAPQPLGLVVTIEPAPVVCENGKCVAILASFCLQQGRLPPGPGDSYLAAPGTEVRLMLTRRDGSVETRAAADLFRFVSRTGFSTVHAELDASVLGDAVSAAVEVGERATLLPAPIAFDPNPLSEQEIALATGPWREQAEALFDKPNPRSDANRIIARAIAMLPEDYRADTAAGHDKAWGTALAAPSRGFTQDGVALGRQMFKACKNTVAQSLKWSLRTCLEYRLDQQQREINDDYWREQGGV